MSLLPDLPGLVFEVSRPADALVAVIPYGDKEGDAWTVMSGEEGPGPVDPIHGTGSVIACDGGFVRVHQAVREQLCSSEIDAVGQMAPRRAEEYLAGRLAGHVLLSRMGIGRKPIEMSSGGRPIFPDGLSGSISHSHGLAAALVSTHRCRLVGLDLQWYDVASIVSVARDILAPGESNEPLGDDIAWGTDPVTVDLILRFSVKEACFKALACLNPPPAWLGMIDFKDFVIRPVSGGAICEPVRALSGWPGLQAAWIWLTLGEGGVPKVSSEPDSDPFLRHIPVWIMAWAWHPV